MRLRLTLTPSILSRWILRHRPVTAEFVEGEHEDGVGDMFCVRTGITVGSALGRTHMGTFAVLDTLADVRAAANNFKRYGSTEPRIPPSPWTEVADVPRARLLAR